MVNLSRRLREVVGIQSGQRCGDVKRAPRGRTSGVMGRMRYNREQNIGIYCSQAPWLRRLVAALAMHAGRWEPSLPSCMHAFGSVLSHISLMYNGHQMSEAFMRI